MNHVVAAAVGLVLDQSSFFSTLLKKLILPLSLSTSFWRHCLPTHRFACLSVRLSARLFQLASGEVLFTILTSNIVGKYPRVFYNYPGT